MWDHLHAKHRRWESNLVKREGREFNKSMDAFGLDVATTEVPSDHTPVIITLTTNHWNRKAVCSNKQIRTITIIEYKAHLIYRCT